MDSAKVIGIVVAVALLGIKLALHSARSSGSSYSSYSSSPFDYQTGFKNLGTYQELLALQEVQRLEAELERERAKLVSHQCQTAPLSHLAVELGWTNPTTRRVGLAVRELELGAELPPLVNVRGLDVGLNHRFGEEDSRWCAQFDRDLVERTAAAAVTVDPKVLGPGAWSIATTNNTAATTLLMSKVFGALKVKGELVAFVPSDNLVVYADSASPKAISLAARTVVEQTDRTGDLGCVSEDVFVLRKGNWVKFASASAEVAQARKVAVECQISQVQQMLVMLSEVRAISAHVPSAAKRAYANGKAQVILAASDEQVIAAADTVLINAESGSYQMPWATFQKHLGASLQPLVLDGAQVTGYYAFSGVYADELEQMGGTKISSAGH